MRNLRVVLAAVFGLISIAGLVLVLGSAIEMVADPSLSNLGSVGGTGICAVISAASALVTIKLAKSRRGHDRPAAHGFSVLPLEPTDEKRQPLPARRRGR